MIQPINNLDLELPGERMTVEEAEQDLLFIGMHSSTGRLMVQFIQGEEVVAVEVASQPMRTKFVSLLIDAVGGELEILRQEAGKA